MPDKQAKVILVTGASSGIGAACAAYLCGFGHKVYGASRSQAPGDKFQWIRCDITREDEVKAAVSAILEKEGRIDVLVNNGGINVTGAIEMISPEDARSQFETNFFGSLNMIRSVLPVMRENRQGRIINISSVGGMMGLPFQGLYSASKFALEGLTESLRMEIRHSGVQATLIAPGDFCTPITRNRITCKYSRSHAFYAAHYATTMKVVAHDESSGTDPLVIAKLVHRLIHTDKLKVRYVAGKPVEKLAVFLKRMLPAELFEMILKKKYL